MKHQIVIALIVILGLTMDKQCSAQYYSETIYTTKDGLKSNEIKDLIQTKDGHLWMINAGELCKFDGKDFTYYPLKNDIKPDWVNIELTELTTGEIMLRSTEFVKFNPITETFIYYADPPIEASNAYRNNQLSGNLSPNGAPFDKNGNVWYVNTKGVFMLFEDSCINLIENSEKGINPCTVRPITDNNGNCWSATKKALYQLKEGNIKKYDLAQFGFDTNSFRPLVRFVTSSGDILFENEFYMIDEKQKIIQADKKFYLLKNNKLDTLHFLFGKKITNVIEKQNKFYFHIGQEGFLGYNPIDKNITKITINEGAGKSAFFGDKLVFYTATTLIITGNNKFIKLKYNWRNINSAIGDNNDNIWLATYKGLIKYSRSTLDYKKTDYSQNWLFKTTERDIAFTNEHDMLDNEGNLWFITEEFGVNKEAGIGQKKLFKFNLKNKTIEQLLPKNKEFQLAWDNYNNAMWIISDRKLYYAKNKVITKNKISLPVTSGEISYKVINGILYASPSKYQSKDSYTYYLTENKFKLVSNKYSLGLGFDRTLNLFLSVPFNDQTQEIRVVQNDNKVSDLLFTLDSMDWADNGCIDSNNDYWIFPYKNQKVYYSSSSLKLKKEKAYPNSGVRNYEIKTAADKSGNVWITSNMGLNFLTIEADTMKSVLISKKEGLSSTIINDLYVDEHNFLWIATDNGVDRLNVSSYLKNGAINFEHFGKKEGLKDVNCTKFVIRNKKLMAFTNSGYAVIDTTIKLTTLDAPEPYFTSIGYSVDGALKAVSSLLENDVVFKNPFGPVYIGYNAIKFNNTKPLQYTTLLYKGGKLLYGSFDNINWTKQEEIKYEDLAPGNYKVELYCRVGNKGVKSEPTILEFTILPAWWQTWWAKGLAILSVVLMLYLLYKQRTKALLKRQEQLEETVKVKTAEVVVQKQEAETQRDVAEEQKLIAEEKNNEILDSLNYAKRLQEAILPSPRLVKEWLTESFILYKPKDIVAGDFYWMETAKQQIDGKEKTLIYFAAADCTGHGVPGAMVSVVCANALNRSIKEFGLTNPGAILDKVSELVVEAFAKSEDEIKDGMDIALCAIDISSKTLFYSGANNSLYRITQRIKGEELPLKSSFTETHKLIEYKATKRPIGAHINNNQFETQEIILEPGDSIYLFSDGYADQFGGEKGKKLKYSTFRQLLLANHNEPMDEQKKILSTAFNNWKGDLEQIDDVCVIGVKVNGIERNNFTESELKVLKCLQEGLPSKLIADKINLSKNTVDTYRRRLLAKTGTYNATELINYCVKKEII